MVISMKINTLLKQAGLEPVLHNHKISKLTSDSRHCVYNAIFVAVRGSRTNGEEYIEEAILNGAKTIVTNALVSYQFKDVNYIYVENPAKTLGKLAQFFYYNVSKKIHLIGVTGTNGKTSTSTIAYKFFNSIGKKSMVIGSNGVYFDGYATSTNNTTPDILSIYQFLNLAQNNHIQYVFMEISSISVDQFRIAGLNFECIIFTNFSQDHLDYHQNLDEYLFCKMIPFIKLKKNAYAIVNKDDEAYSKIVKYCDANIISYGFKEACDFYATVNEVNEHGCSFYVKNGLYKSKLLGEFNLYNLLSVLTLCDIYDIPYWEYGSFLTTLEPIDGRMNQIILEDKTIIIDYAHTFKATKLVIENALRLCKGKVVVVLGCGGNREKEKRGMIGELLGTLPIQVILTTDNPRYEDPKQIVSDIKEKLEKECLVILNRKEAVTYALDHLKSNDYLLILGKGSEPYMDIAGVKYPYSDYEVIEEWQRSN